MRNQVVDYYRAFPGRKGILNTWVRNIALIIAAAILSVALSSLASQMVFTRHADRANTLLLEQIGTAMDIQIQDAQKSLLRFLSDLNVSQIARASDLSDISLTANKMEIIKSISTYCQLNGFIDNIYLYFKQQDYLITAETLGSTAISYYANYKEYFPDYSIWRSRFFDCESGNLFLMPTSKVRPSKGTSNVLYYALSNDNASVRDAVRAYFSVEGGKLTLSISKMASENDNGIAVLLDGGSVFVSNDYDLWQKIAGRDDVKEAITRCGEAVVKCAIREGSLYIRKSAYIDVYYAILIPLQQGFVYQSPVLWALLAGIVSILLASFLSMQRITASTVVPLMQLRSMLKRDNIGREDNELSLIRDAIEEANSQVQSLSSQLDLNRNKLQGSYLLRLLQGECQPYEQRQMLAALGFDQSSFAVLLFSLTDNEWVLSENTEASVFLILQYEEINTLAQAKGILLKYVMLSDVYAIVANLNQAEGESWQELSESVAHKVVADWWERFDVQLSYAYSKAHTDNNALCRSYAEALFTLRHKLLHAPSYALGEQKPRFDEPLYCFPLSERNRLTNMITNAQQTQIVDCIEGLWRQNAMGEFANILLDCLSNDLAGVLLSIADSIALGGQERHDLMLRMAYMQKLYVPDRKEILIEMALSLSKQCSVDRQDEQKLLYDQILEYIRQHYNDPLLSVENICSRFNRSHNYIYTAVKSVSGEGILHAINTIRLEKAKALLLEKNATVEKAAKAVGLNSALALFRIFKRYEGITPSDYMRQHQMPNL